MGATFAFRDSGSPAKVPGAFYESLLEVTGDTSYPLVASSGYPVGIAQLQTLTGGAGSKIESVDVVNNWTDNAAGAAAKCFVANYDKTHGTVRGFSGGSANTSMVEVADTNGALSALTCTLRIRWR